MTKKVHFKFYIFTDMKEKKYECGYDMLIDNVFVMGDNAGAYSTPAFALYRSQQKVVDFIDILNKIGTVPVEYSYSMGRIFYNA